MLTRADSGYSEKGEASFENKAWVGEQLQRFKPFLLSRLENEIQKNTCRYTVHIISVNNLNFRKWLCTD